MLSSSGQSTKASNNRLQRTAIASVRNTNCYAQARNNLLLQMDEPLAYARSLQAKHSTFA